jgi:hypothetical protein
MRKSLVASSGFVIFNKKSKDWMWYSSNTHLAIYLKLMIEVNYEDRKWQNLTIKKNQILTSIEHLSLLLSTPKTTLKRILKDFEESGDITVETTNKYTLITLNNLFEGEIENKVKVKELKSKEKYFEKSIEVNLGKDKLTKPFILNSDFLKYLKEQYPNIAVDKELVNLFDQHKNKLNIKNPRRYFESILKKLNGEANDQQKN